ncbi:cib [Trypoxylus dichotomus]
MYRIGTQTWSKCSFPVKTSTEATFHMERLSPMSLGNEGIEESFWVPKYSTSSYASSSLRTLRRNTPCYHSTFSIKMMNEFQLPEHSSMEKRPKLDYYFRLESESSIASEEDTESVNSIQAKETDYVQDTEDTDSSYFEYEVASLSENEDDDITHCISSSGSDNDILVTEEVIAAVLGDTSLEAWAPDDEEDSSTTDVEEFGKTDFWTCAQCKSKNNNPQFRLCEKCFQVRKTFYPPRPKRCKKRKIQSNKEAVNVDNLRSCLSGLSQDSGVGSSQEFPSLDFKEIRVPEQHLISKCDSPPSSNSTSNGCSAISSSDSSSAVRTSGPGSASNSAITTTTTTSDTTVTSRKRKYSENSDSSDTVRAKKIVIEKPAESNATEDANDIKAELKDLCMICNMKTKDGLFLHGGYCTAFLTKYLTFLAEGQISEECSSVPEADKSIGFNNNGK